MDVDWHAQYFHVTFTFPSMCVCAPPDLSLRSLKSGLAAALLGLPVVGILLLFERASL